MTDIYVKTFEENLTLNPLTINPLTVNPLTIADVQKIAPVGVHIKELNQIAPLFVESLRVDHVRHIDPLRIERLNITQLPSVNLSLEPTPAARSQCSARSAGGNRAAAATRIDVELHDARAAAWPGRHANGDSG